MNPYCFYHRKQANKQANQETAQTHTEKHTHTHIKQASKYTASQATDQANSTWKTNKSNKHALFVVDSHTHPVRWEEENSACDHKRPLLVVVDSWY